LLPVAALAGALLASGPSDGASWLFTAAARTHPAGGILGVEGLLALDDEGTLRAGAYLNYAYYWGEMGAKLEWRYLDGFIVAGLSLGVEPGDFIPEASDRTSRKPGLRGLAKLRININYRHEWLWIYSRSTVVGRVRTFAEYDPFRAAVLGHELSAEQALAPMFRLFEYGEGSRLWVYVEGTIEGELSAGLLDVRPSAGLIYESVLPGVTLNVDVYRSFKAGPREGWGALAFVWWRL